MILLPIVMPDSRRIESVSREKSAPTVRGKVVWITGASSGIGEALAIALAAAGAKIVLSARRQAQLERVRKLCGDDADIFILPLDLTDFESASANVDRVIERYGRLDILVNNAGVSQRALADETPLFVDRQVMDVDYFGHVALTKAVLPHMIEAASGHVVVVSSITGLVPIPLRSAYCAAKHALHGFFNTLRAEVHQHNIAVTLFCPANINTAISVNAVTASGEAYGKMDSLQERGMSPEECAVEIIASILKRKQEVLAGPFMKNIVRLHRFFPRIYRWLLARRKTFV